VGLSPSNSASSLLDLGRESRFFNGDARSFLTLDKDVGRALEAALIDEGIEVVTDAQWLRATRDATGKTVWVMKDGLERSYTGKEILQALGRRPTIEGPHLDLAEVTVDGG
jgi:pyruvate/2-oxoglutarate dehydrogenase complex dihydrolipoamide dehydrogenase (E3) component